MTRFPNVFLALIACVTLAACDQQANRRIHGLVYFGAGGYLGQFNVANGDSAIVTGVGDANIRQVHDMHGNRILLVMDVFQNTREVSMISWIDVRTLQLNALFEGVTVAWLPEYETYVYDDGSRLLAVTHSDDQDTDNVILSHRLNAVSRIHVVSDSAVIFASRNRGSEVIHQYDVNTRVLRTLDALAEICDFGGSVWVADLGQLACRSRSDRNGLLLVNLDGSDAAAIEFPGGGTYRPITALSGQNVLLVTEVRQGRAGGRPALPVSAYWLDTGELSSISDNQYLGLAVAFRD